MAQRVLLFGCGTAVGMFVGVLVGMSASPVVATVVSGLVGVVTMYCTATLGGGLREALKPAGADERPAPTIEPHVFLAGFSAFGVAAVFLGLYVRTHNLLSPTPKEIVAQWQEAGLQPAEARQVALNILEGNTTTRLHDSIVKSVLIEGDLSKCNEITSDINRKEWNLAERAFEDAGDDWAKRMAELRGQPDDVRHEAMAKFAHDRCNHGTVK